MSWSESFAIGQNDALLDAQNGFGILALLAQNEFLNETVQHILELGRIVRTVDDVTFVLEIELSLSAQFAAEVLGAI